MKAWSWELFTQWSGQYLSNLSCLERCITSRVDPDTLWSTHTPWQCSRSISWGEAAQRWGLWSGRGSPTARHRRGSRTLGKRSSWSPGSHSVPSAPAPGACCTHAGSPAAGCRHSRRSPIGTGEIAEDFGHCKVLFFSTLVWLLLESFAKFSNFFPSFKAILPLYLLKVIIFPLYLLQVIGFINN